jgi:hypothetical protein
MTRQETWAGDRLKDFTWGRGGCFPVLGTGGKQDGEDGSAQEQDADPWECGLGKGEGVEAMAFRGHLSRLLPGAHAFPETSMRWAHTAVLWGQGHAVTSSTFIVLGLELRA